MRGQGPYAEEILPTMVGTVTVAELEVIERGRMMMRGTPPRGAAAAPRGRAERRVAVPTLMAAGADDGLTPVGDARLFRGPIPGAEPRIIDDTGHLPDLERPFDAALTEFLDRVPAAEAAGGR